MFNIALIGFGAVGKSFVKLLEMKKDLLHDVNLKYIIKSDGGIYDEDGLNIDELMEYTNNKKIQNHPMWSDISIKNILENKDVDILIELTSTNIVDGEPGYTHIRESLKNGIDVVTGNKGPILLHYKELKGLANKNNLYLKIGCTTGGALPSVNAGTTDVLGAKVTEITGVLNGTTNFILEEMLKNRVEYEEALKKAQDLNIAEKDPSLDVLGYDTAVKMAILSEVIWNVDFDFDKLDINGITNVKLDDLLSAKANDDKVKLVARASYLDGNFKFEVKPTVISSDHPLYSVDGKNKGVHYKTDILGDITVTGGASAPLNAAASILRDLLYIIQNRR
ncbi:MAG: homoserine dehydrogenase [Intestinibacter sp.]|uniref:homoserine dehydrogenase n=1 Tax=Intestinibacter sp. TaxID=1965304 RepID=UPI002A8026BC|nr:homoserine dehydrogenase [Intestinibacter sp.]MDY4575580.1 homoserine dehydrogenase [Intestinibacter sp.]